MKVQVPEIDPGRIYTPAEVARYFHVDPKTVTRWAKAGRIGSFRTLGGQRRYWGSAVIEAIKETSQW